MHCSRSEDNINQDTLFGLSKIPFCQREGGITRTDPTHATTTSDFQLAKTPVPPFLLRCLIHLAATLTWWAAIFSSAGGLLCSWQPDIKEIQLPTICSDKVVMDWIRLNNISFSMYSLQKRREEIISTSRDPSIHHGATSVYDVLLILKSHNMTFPQLSSIGRSSLGFSQTLFHSQVLITYHT